MFAARPPLVRRSNTLSGRADTIIYSDSLPQQVAIVRVLPDDAAVFQAIYSARGKRAMERLARETGGAYFEVSRENPIEKIYASIEEQLRNQYSIGYTPERNDARGRYRQIRLSTRQPGLLVQTRVGYYAE